MSEIDVFREKIEEAVNKFEARKMGRENHSTIVAVFNSLRNMDDRLLTVRDQSFVGGGGLLSVAGDDKYTAEAAVERVLQITGRKTPVDPSSVDNPRDANNQIVYHTYKDEATVFHTDKDCHYLNGNNYKSTRNEVRKHNLDACSSCVETTFDLDVEITSSFDEVQEAAEDFVTTIEDRRDFESNVSRPFESQKEVERAVNEASKYDLMAGLICDQYDLESATEHSKTVWDALDDSTILHDIRRLSVDEDGELIRHADIMTFNLDLEPQAKAEA